MILSNIFPDDVRAFFQENFDLRIPCSPYEKVTSDNIMHATGLPFLELPFIAPFEKIAEEAQALYGKFSVFEPRKASHYLGQEKPLYEKREDAEGWTSLTIHGLGWDKAGHHSNYGFEESLSEDELPYVWTDVADRVPETVAWLKSTFAVHKFYRIRFMILEPGRCVFPHRGKLNPDGRAELGPVNIAIVNPSEFYFLVKGAGPIPFQPGKCFWFAPGFDHSLVNLSSQPRLHLIVEANFKREFYSAAFERYQKKFGVAK